MDILDPDEEFIPQCPEEPCGQGCPCGCQSLCHGLCGKGCYGYRYDPRKAAAVPPINPGPMLHFLEFPEHLKARTCNRGFLPKRSEALQQGPDQRPVEGWGLHFEEAVWEAPIIVIEWLSILGTVATVVVWTVLAERLWKLAGIPSGALCLAFFQALAKAMQKWAESKIKVKVKKE